MIMQKNKKSQGISITTIIVAIIGLVVLVVVVLMLTGNLGVFSKGANEGEKKGEDLWKELGWEGGSATPASTTTTTTPRATTTSTTTTLDCRTNGQGCSDKPCCSPLTCSPAKICT